MTFPTAQGMSTRCVALISAVVQKLCFVIWARISRRKLPHLCTCFCTSFQWFLHARLHTRDNIYITNDLLTDWNCVLNTMTATTAFLEIYVTGAQAEFLFCRYVEDIRCFFPLSHGGPCAGSLDQPFQSGSRHSCRWYNCHSWLQRCLCAALISLKIVFTQIWPSLNRFCSLCQ